MFIKNKTFSLETAQNTDPGKVKRLYIWHKDLSALVGKIGIYENLVELDISWTQSKEIPEEIKRLRKLKKLVILNADIDYFPEWICDMITLKELMVRGTSLTAIPKNIDNLINLKRLELGVNPIKVLPKEIGKLKKLKFLGLHDTKITSIPDEILALPKLKHLGLTATAIDVKTRKDIEKR